MKTFHTHLLDPHSIAPQDREWIYNGLDCCITAEVLDVLLPQLDDGTNATYSFSKALQGPVLEMRLRGVLVDRVRQEEVIEEYQLKLDDLEAQLYTLVSKGLGMWGFNWRSNRDLQELFYERLQIPIYKKQGRPTVDRDAIEKMEAYLVARPIVRHLIAMRELGKRIGVLKSEIDADGRYRTSYNIAGTSTGRFSSSLSEFGTGGNLQNIEDSLRSIFIADPGMKMAYLDAEQGESRCVGAIEWNLFEDSRYLDSCESGDLHTSVAKLVWPNLAWTGNIKQDKKLAEQPYYRHYDRRFMCKKIGHGTNYGGKPGTISTQAKVELSLVREFQPKYFAAFPAHHKWHAWVDEQIRKTGKLTSLTGRRRHFFGRRDSDDTLREAIAFDPQGSLADIVNTGMLAVWRAGDCQLLMQNHDAIVVQYRETEEDRIIPKILRQLEHTIGLRDNRRFVIPYGVKTGWNFGEFSASNPNGLKAYTAGDKRKRQAAASLLDRVVRRVHR